MKLTLSVSYGIGILLQILEHSDGEPLTAAKIARGCRFPPRFLYRVLRRLVDAGLLNGTSGPGGGYVLSRRPERISLLDIAGGVESDPQPSRLEAVCPRQRGAMAHVNHLCRQNAQRFASELSRVSLADLKRMNHAGRLAGRPAQKNRSSR